MKRILSISLLIALALAFMPYGTALADGAPVIIVEPSVAAPGNQITITGSDWEEGEVMKITLESAAGVFNLGEATVAPDGAEAGFTVAFTLPSDLTPGSYLVRCVAKDGHTATADLTIAASSGLMNKQTEASAEPLALDRSKTPLVIGSVIVLALLSAGAGVWLVRKSH